MLKRSVAVHLSLVEISTYRMSHALALLDITMADREVCSVVRGLGPRALIVWVTPKILGVAYKFLRW